MLDKAPRHAYNMINCACNSCMRNLIFAAYIRINCRFIDRCFQRCVLYYLSFRPSDSERKNL